jgi:twitching motility protein PilI
MTAHSSRQSLKQLQERLADRMARAKKTGVEASWLAVESAGHHLLLPLAQSGELFPVSPPQPVPHTQAWFLGVLTLRGGLVGVVDLAGFFAKGADGHVSPVRPESKLVAINAALGVNVVLLVDRVVGLRSAGMFVEMSTPQNALPFFSHTLTDAKKQEWQELDLQALVDWPDFLNVVA